MNDVIKIRRVESVLFLCGNALWQILGRLILAGNVFVSFVTSISIKIYFGYHTRPQRALAQEFLYGRVKPL